MLFWATILNGQVYPGDANQSGRADHQDMLYIGYAYASSGPSRIQTGTAFTEMPISVPWESSFPNGTNYAHADANGDGQVNIADMLTVVSNYGKAHLPPTEPIYPPAFPETDPSLRFIPDVAGAPLTAGSSIILDVRMEYPGIPDADINGLAFSVNFNKNYIQSISMGFGPEWLGGTSSSFRFQNIDPQQTDQLDIATTRYGISRTTASGQVGTLSIVIEDDLITFMQLDSVEIALELASIMLVDDELNLQPVNTDTIFLTIYNPNYLISSQGEEKQPPFRCFPNPVLGRQLNLSSPQPMQEARIYDMLGIEAFRRRSSGAHDWAIQLPEGWPGGYYLIRVYCKGGRINEQLLFIP